MKSRYKEMAEARDKPQGLDVVEAEAILRDLLGLTSISQRMDRASDRFLGRSYLDAPLGGGFGQSEVFTATFEGFDCVTYIETVLALALANTISEFTDLLRRIRYDQGKVNWTSRNHYMVDWAERNEAVGFVINLTTGEETREKTCALNLIAGTPAKTVTFQYFPSPISKRVFDKVKTGDLSLFVSQKDTLDVFHTGILIEKEGQIAVRHATRKTGAVIEQSLSQFANVNAMNGLVLLRPLWRP